MLFLVAAIFLIQAYVMLRDGNTIKNSNRMFYSGVGLVILGIISLIVQLYINRT